jgi:hypothetical protein
MMRVNKTIQEAKRKSQGEKVNLVIINVKLAVKYCG